MAGKDKKKPKYTTKQMGDACEMIVAGEMTLAGVPTQKMADNWPGYDLIAQPTGIPPQRISVKARTHGPGYFAYRNADAFEWIAAVILDDRGENVRSIFIIPRAVADARATKDGKHAKTDESYWTIIRTREKFPEFENNFDLTAVAVETKP